MFGLTLYCCYCVWHVGQLWDVDAGKQLRCITEHEGTVKCLLDLEQRAFCSGGSDLCLWNRQGTLMTKHSRLSEDSDIHHILRVQHSRVVVATDSCNLDVYAIDVGAMRISLTTTLEAHREAVRCLVSGPEGMFLTGSLDGSVILWSSMSLTKVRILNFHDVYFPRTHEYSYRVTHICTHEHFVIFASGHGFQIYNGSTGAQVAAVRCAHFLPVTVLLLLDAATLLLTASADAIRLWSVLVSQDFCVSLTFGGGKR